MCQPPLVEGQISVGQQLIDRLREEGISVVAAAWVNETGSDRWELYLVTPSAGRGGRRGSAYRRIQEMKETVPAPVWLGPFQITVLGPSEPIGKAMIYIQRRYPGGRPGWYR